jgi:hypothetical protein
MGSYIQKLDAIKDAIDGEMDGIEVGEKITLECVEMSKEEYEKLQEFAGW